MKVAEVFRRPIERRIEEVIKVELDDEKTVAEELTEYVATDRIQAAMGQVLDSYQETIDNPTEDTNVWISGVLRVRQVQFRQGARLPRS